MSLMLKERILKKKANGEKLLSIYITAGFPKKKDTVRIIKSLAKAGVDFVELGMPFSDPIADGPVIQNASLQALQNGITTEDIFSIVQEVRRENDIPILLMGYTNTLIKYGVEKFIKKAVAVGADGLIIPDWPLEENMNYLKVLNKHNLDLIHLIAPNTSKERIREIDKYSTAFIYCVAYMGVTGNDNKPTAQTDEFFKYLQNNLTNPWLIGFGVKSPQDYQTYNSYADGVIIGTAFINLLEETAAEERDKTIVDYIKKIRG